MSYLVGMGNGPYVESSCGCVWNAAGGELGVLTVCETKGCDFTWAAAFEALRRFEEDQRSEHSTAVQIA